MQQPEFVDAALLMELQMRAPREARLHHREGNADASKLPLSVSATNLQ